MTIFGKRNLPRTCHPRPSSPRSFFVPAVVHPQVPRRDLRLLLSLVSVKGKSHCWVTYEHFLVDSVVWVLIREGPSASEGGLFFALSFLVVGR